MGASHRSGEKGHVLLTGANGFTGQYVRMELEKAGYQVSGAGAQGPLNDHVLDITSLDNCRSVMQLAKPDFVVHLAAISFVQHSSAEAFYRVNVTGTTNLLQALVDAESNPKSVIIASSANIYGNAASGIIDETHPPRPVNHYAASKLAMEHMARTFDDRLPVTITRPFNYTGIGQPPHFLVPKIVDHFVRREPVIELGNIDVERDFSDVRDVAEAYCRLMESGCPGQTVNICSGRPYTLHHIIELMQGIAGYEIRVKVNPKFVRHSEVKTLVGSTEKLCTLIGERNAIPFEDTLRWMAKA